jgi:ABC-2 type transport system permease protein
MLAFKAWRESRARFLLSAATLGWFCALFILARPLMQEAASTPFTLFVAEAIYTGAVRNLFVIFVIVLGLGGLLEEASGGSASFTLSLPVTRARLVSVRAAVGVAEVCVLAFVPTAAVLGLAPLLHESYAVGDAIRFSMQWAAAGAVLFAVAFQFSTWLSGAYASLTGSIIAVGAYALAVNLTPVQQVPALNVFALMGRSHPDLLRLAGTGLASAVIIAASAWVTDRQDF